MTRASNSNQPARLPRRDYRRAGDPRPDIRRAGAADGTGSEQQPRRAPRDGEDGASWWRGMALAVVATVVLLSLIQAFIGRLYVVPSGSMEPTFHGCAGCENDRIAVERVSYYSQDPQPGDVIVFASTPSWDGEFTVERSHNVLVRGLQNLLSLVGLVPNADNILTKRVIATGGQTVSCQAGDPAVMVDGRPTDQSFVLTPPVNEANPLTGSEACGGDYFGPVTVPEESLWVMGDSRTNSLDSRAHLGDNRQGTVPVDNVRGKVRAVVLPLGRGGIVKHPDIQG